MDISLNLLEDDRKFILYLNSTTIFAAFSPKLKYQQVNVITRYFLPLNINTESQMVTFLTFESLA